MAEYYQTGDQLRRKQIASKKREDEAAIAAIALLGIAVVGLMVYKQHKQTTSGVGAVRNSETSNYQTGDEIDVLFADNLNTEMFYENNLFPVLKSKSDLRWMGLQYSDYVENAKAFGAYSPDERFTICLKSGRVIDVEDFDPATVQRVVKPSAIESGDILWIIYDTAFGSEFWFNGQLGLESMQKQTGWFDMDLYTDWI